MSFSAIHYSNCFLIKNTERAHFATLRKIEEEKVSSFLYIKKCIKNKLVKSKLINTGL